MNDTLLLLPSEMGTHVKLPTSTNGTQQNLTPAFVNPAILQAQDRWIKAALGREFLLQVQIDAEAEPVPAPTAALLPYIKKALAYYAYSIMLVKGIIQVTPTGTQTMTADYSTQPNDRLLAIAVNNEEASGNSAIDDMKAFLDENIDNYPLWRVDCKRRPTSNNIFA